jgi:phosphoglycolate phosphatase
MAVKAKSIIFDLDGTLIDSAPCILAGFEYVLKVNGIEPLVPLTSSVIGPPLLPTLKMLGGINDETKLLQMAGQFKNFYDLDACLLSRPYDAVDFGLKKLGENGFELHIATNKRYTPTRNILKYLGWDGLFTSVYTLDKDGASFNSKSVMIESQLKDFGLSACQAIYVGDRVEDMEAAQKNQLNFIGVSWGYGEFPEHVTVIESFDQLDSLIE